MASEDVYCTLVMSDAYLPGATVLAHSLRDCGTTRKLACLVTMDSLRVSTLDRLKSLYDHVLPVPRVANPTPKNLYLMNRADLLFAFTKIYLWRQTQFSKIIYLDADVVALRAPEELFNTCEDFAAAPDVGWPDIFNTGVMVLTPNEGDFRALQNMAAVGDSFDGADQGLLNQYFEHKPWKRLSFAYNCTPSANYQYEPAYRYFKQNISLVHFIGNTKPWSHGRTSHTNAGAYQELASRWWAVYDRHLEVSPSEYIDGQTHRATAIVASSAQQRASQSLTQTSEIDATQTELPVTEEQEAYEVGEITSQPAQGSEFSAPSMDWDATRAPPPTTSRPEAANFPTQVYEFNTDVKAFHPPARYPDPPKNMWYEVPAEKPPVEHKPAPIFPWEERDVKPTRRFAEDEVNTAEPTTSSTDDSAYDIATDEFEVSNEQSTASVLSVPPVSDTETWRSFGSSGKNAWDEVSGIEDYVRALTSRQKNRGKVQVVSTDQPSAFPPQSSSPLKDLAVDHLAEDVKTRRESLILTDFPTAIERPSLPVTPAPRRRVIFWGEERDDEGNLPSAEGVPDQIDWDPVEQLEQLRRNSLLGPEQLNLSSRKSIPDRQPVQTAGTVTKQADVVADSVVAPTSTETAEAKALA